MRLARPLFIPVLAALAAVAACSRATTRPAVADAAAATAIAPGVRELPADQQVLHALDRLTFGARPGDAARVRAIGLDRWIAMQLEPARIPDEATDRFLARFEVLGLDEEALVRDYAPPALLLARRDTSRRFSERDSAEYREAARRAQAVGQQLVAARVARAVMSDRQLQEVMVDFWENHFNVFAGKNPLMRHYLVAFDRDAIRPHALGNFRELLGAVAKSPAMLTYLDNAQSVADSGRPVLRGPGTRDSGLGMRRGRRRAMQPSPQSRIPGPQPRVPNARQRRGLNENYARELLELHTLGVDGGYTQQDVIEVARALTGWTVVPPRREVRGAIQRVAEPLGPGSVFLPPAHDAGEKRVLGHVLPAGRGVEDGEAVLDIVARHPATARFIATKLARRFVSDTPPAALVERAAATFRRTDGDIREVVRTIVTSPEFFSRAAYRAKVKTPLEVVVSALRALDAAPDPTPRTAALVGRLGQPLFGHQAPNGWPETGDAWINTGAILNRINFGMAAAAGRIPGIRRERWPFPASLDTAARAAQVDAVVAGLLGGGVSPDTRAILISGANPFLAAAPPDSARTSEDSVQLAEAPPEAMMTPPRPERDPSRVLRPRQMARDPFAPAQLDGLAQIVGLALGAPEFQRK